MRAEKGGKKREMRVTPKWALKTQTWVCFWVSTSSSPTRGSPWPPSSFSAAGQGLQAPNPLKKKSLGAYRTAN